MTKAELIKELREYHDDIEVWCHNAHGGGISESIVVEKYIEEDTEKEIVLIW